MADRKSTKCHNFNYLNLNDFERAFKVIGKSK